MTGIGHNKGPSLEPGAGWRTYAWKRARADLLGQKVPIEIVRQRVVRARELGLAYPQYARVLMGSGRDIVGFLFTCDGLGLRLRQRLEMPEAVQRKLGGLERTTLAAFAPEAEDPEAFRRELIEVSGLTFAGSGAEPRGEASWSEIGAAVRAALAPARLPGRSVVLIGSREAEADWVLPGRLAGFVASCDYFGGT